MNKDKLLIPRVKLYSPYPNMEQSIGHVFVGDEYTDLCEKFPNNFRLLKWWENLNMNELPSYVLQLTIKGDNKKWRVLEYVFDYQLKPPDHFFEPYIVTDNIQRWQIPLSMCLPLSKTEYDGTTR